MEVVGGVGAAETGLFVEDPVVLFLQAGDRLDGGELVFFEFVDLVAQFLRFEAAFRDQGGFCA